MVDKHWYHDTTHPVISTVAAQGVAQSLETVLERLQQEKLDVSPKLDVATTWFLVVANQYRPKPVTLQLTQDIQEKPEGFYTQIVSTGIGPAVEKLALQAAEFVRFVPKTPDRSFVDNVILDQEPFKLMYVQFTLFAPPSKASQLLATALAARQREYHDGTWKKLRN